MDAPANQQTNKDAVSVLATSLGKDIKDVPDFWRTGGASRCMKDPLFITKLVLEGVSNDLIEYIISLFLSHGANADAKNSDGKYLLQQILSFPISNEVRMEKAHSLIKLCHFLVKKCKVDVSVRTYNGHSVIHLVLQLLRHLLNQEAAQASGIHTTSREIAESLLKLLHLICERCSQNLCSSQSDVDGNSPLHLWASIDSPTAPSLETILSDIGELLLSKGANVNVTNANGETPLHVAQTWNAAKFLICHKAVLTRQDRYGSTPLLKHIKQSVGKHTLNKVYSGMGSESLSEQWKEVLHLFEFAPWKANNEGETILSLLLQKDAYDMILGFLKATGAPYGLEYPVDSNGDTPLHVIVKHSKDNKKTLKLIRFLVVSCAIIVNHPNKDNETPLHILCKRSEANLPKDVITELRRYGALPTIASSDGKTCFDEAPEKPSLMALLKKDLKLHETKVLLTKWQSKSKRHKEILRQVARGQHVLVKDQFWCYADPIAYGEFGPVYAAIDSNSGREVALRKVLKKDLERIPIHMHLTHQYLVEYFPFSIKEHHYHYLVCELMEGNIEDLLDNGILRYNSQILVESCQGILQSLQYLHTNGVTIEIKPSMILYTETLEGLLQFKFSNTGDRSTGTSRHSTYSRCWMAPEQLNHSSNPTVFSNVFSFGIIMHYILTKGMHPFLPRDPGEDNAKVQSEIVSNILSNKQNFSELSPEAEDLLTLMLTVEAKKRIRVDHVLRHPLFWDRGRRHDFLVKVGNQCEFSEHMCNNPRCPMLKKLFGIFEKEFRHNEWSSHVRILHAEMTDPSSRIPGQFNTGSAVSLVRFIRHADAHAVEKSPFFQNAVYQERVFLDKFPKLLIEVFKLVKKFGWSNKEQLKSFFGI